MQTLLLGKRAYTTSVTKHDHIGHEVYEVGFVVGCFCLYPSCSRDSLFCTFMTKESALKFFEKCVHEGG